MSWNTEFSMGRRCMKQQILGARRPNAMRYFGRFTPTGVYGGEMLIIIYTFPDRIYDSDFFMGGNVRKYLAQDSHIVRNRRKKGMLGKHSPCCPAVEMLC